jgi:hypothetical protein
MIATAIAVIELLLLLILGFLVGAKAFGDKTEAVTAAAVKREAPKAAETSSQDGKAAGHEKQKAAALLPRWRTSVVVLNGNGIPGAAATTADQAHELRYIITATGNAPTSFSRSVVMFRPGLKPAAQRLAKDMSIKRVTPLDGITKGDLQGAQLALIIGG